MRTLTNAALFMCALVALATVVPQRLQPALAQAVPGTIAYARRNNQTGYEIWLIEPDGSNDRRIWSSGIPHPNNIDDITRVEWRPDAGEIAFSSRHERACSIYEADIYAIWPDGSNYRRITNAPACAALANFPKGSVSVTVRNSTTRNPLYVYVQGAPTVQSAVVPQGGSATVTFADVADFGDGVLQQAVAFWGLERWNEPLALADVKPGQTVHAGTLEVSGAGIQQFGVRHPTWHRDGSRLGWILAGCAIMQQIPANPPAGATGTALTTAYVPACVMDWGPTPALANQILYGVYTTEYGIYRVTEGSGTKGELLVSWGPNLVLDIQWLPDGSGFLYSRTDRFSGNWTAANIYEYTFATRQVTQLTQFTDEIAGAFSISPDGQYVVFERVPQLGWENRDVWMMRRDGTGMRRLVQYGLFPSWSPRAPQPPKRLYLPHLRR